MKAYQVSAWMVGAAVALLAGSSASEAGWFRGRGRCYSYPAESTGYAATSALPSAAPAPAAAAATSGPVVYQANRPVVAVETSPAELPAAANYSPRYAPRATSGGSSVMPRSSWDFGSFPPFR
jgi:hypothetical protein